VAAGDPQRADGSRILLPLRTSVDLFSDPLQPSALTRAKQAAVLHDTVIAEVGFLDVSLTERGGITWWTPPEQMTEQHAARARKPPERGEPMTLAFGKHEALGKSASEMTTAISGPISMAYGAEWHTEVIASLEAFGADFIELIATGGGDIPISDPLGQAVSRQNFADFSDKSLMPGVNTFERDFIFKSFNRDAAVANALGAVVQVSTLFEPMLQRRGWDPTGTTAVHVAAPNLGALSWEQVLDFRQHPGAGESRQMLTEFERIAATQEPRDAEHFLLQVSQQVTDGLMAALFEHRTKVPRAIAEEAAKTGISFIPVVGPFVGAAASAAQIGAEKLHESRSGIAALMKLRGE
jgi:hypothetical protein